MAQVETTIFRQWANTLQDRVDQHSDVLYGKQHDLLRDKTGIPHEIEDVLAETHEKSKSSKKGLSQDKVISDEREADWHSLSTDSSRRVRPLTESYQPSPSLQKTGEKASQPLTEPATPLRKRKVSILRRFRLWLMVKVANSLIKKLTKLDDFLVRRFSSDEKATEKSEKPVQNRKVTRSPSKTTRESIIGSLISENTEDLIGVVYPNGIPEQELKLYTNPRLIVLKGEVFNQYGHALLAFGDPTSDTDRYVQISSANWYPEHMNGTEYHDYLHKWNAETAYEVSLDCKNEEAMRATLDELSSKKWLWGGPVHNCMTFCKEIGVAGEIDFEFFTGATFDNRFQNAILQGALSGLSEAFNYLRQQDKASEAMVEQLDSVENTIADTITRELEKQLEKVINERYEKDLAISEDMVPTLPVAQTLLQSVIDKMPDQAGFDSLPADYQEIVQKRFLASAGNAIKEGIERESRLILENDVRDLADLPMASAYNAPVDKRKVGPQSTASWFDDSDL
ncbi:hypothetical protein GZ77_05030 [Endozoicomonas montiporae]|uniref:Uncharacterized protein n=2 Tax=Endozoicomonas montiporae TaxID=1027273 RepID=A0A081NBQ7_9GAMM|nr:hypothetical protein [Endozoicomonas montiporae]AMO56177.1 hypothetical protein EZMO1_2058 [Endozoicomonas montiporae CL-33]KEQ15880.1 hypothetical protein GZ77_05030 [Endozoicomonas montiporae]